MLQLVDYCCISVLSCLIRQYRIPDAYVTLCRLHILVIPILFYSYFIQKFRQQKIVSGRSDNLTSELFILPQNDWDVKILWHREGIMSPLTFWQSGSVWLVWLQSSHTVGVLLIWGKYRATFNFKQQSRRPSPISDKLLLNNNLHRFRAFEHFHCYHLTPTVQGMLSVTCNL